MGTTRKTAPRPGGGVLRPAVAPHPPAARTAVPEGPAQAAPRPDVNTAARTPDPARPLRDRQIRRIVLHKASRTLVYHLGDGSTHTARVLRHCDFPPGTYAAKPQPGPGIRWACPQELTPYLAESGHQGTDGRRYSVLLDRADQQANPGTFEGVSGFDFEVVGERLAPGLALDTEHPGLREALDSPELRRYLALGRRDTRRPPSRERPDPDALSPDEAVALVTIHERLSLLNEEEWKLLEAQAETAAPATSWAEAAEKIGRFVRGAADLREFEKSAIARLTGAEELYEAIKTYDRVLGGSLAHSEWKSAFDDHKKRLKQDMERHLKARGFADRGQFDTAVRNLRLVIRPLAFRHAMDSLKESERILKAEQERYRGRDTLNWLLTDLRKLIDPNGPAAQEATIRVLDRYPLLRDKVVFKGAVEAKYPEFLGELLRQNAGAQLGNVARTREALLKDPDLVFSFDLVINETFEKLGYSKDSAQTRAIREGYGVKRRNLAREIFDMVLLVLCFASGPLGWVGYLANLAAFVTQVSDLRDRERRKDQINAAVHAGRPLATAPSNDGDLLQALAIVLAGANLIHVPVPRAAPVVARETTALLRVRPAPRTRAIGLDAVEISLPGHSGTFRMNRHGWEAFEDAGATRPLRAESWIEQGSAARPGLQAQAPQLANVRAAAGIRVGEDTFLMGVTADGWFVYAPGTRTPLQTGTFHLRALGPGPVPGPVLGPEAKIAELLERAKRKAGPAAAPARNVPGGRWEWKGLHLNQAVSESADRALARARAAERRISPKVESVAKELDATMAGFPEHVLKGPDRFKEKLATTIEAAPASTVHVEGVIGEIHDAIRYTYVFDDAKYAEGVIGARAALERQGFELVLQKPSWSKAEKYKGVNTRWRDPDGQLFEVQMHTRDSLRAKEVTHEIYEYKKILDPEDAKLLETQEAEIFRGVTNPPGVEDIKPFKKED